jgi:hypothetical protein
MVKKRQPPPPTRAGGGKSVSPRCSTCLDLVRCGIRLSTSNVRKLKTVRQLAKTLVRRGKKWFRYDAPDKRLFKQLQKTLTAPDQG